MVVLLYVKQEEGEKIKKVLSDLVNVGFFNMLQFLVIFLFSFLSPRDSLFCCLLATNMSFLSTHSITVLVASDLNFFFALFCNLTLINDALLDIGRDSTYSLKLAF